MPTRKIIAFTILASGIAVFFIIIFSSHREIPKAPLLINVTAQKSSNLDFRREAPSLNTSAAIPSFISQKLSGSTGEVENLTEILARAYASEIYKLNPAGPDEIKGQKSLRVLPQEAAVQLLEEQIQNGFKIQMFTEKDIKVISDNSQKAHLSYYIEALDIIIGGEKLNHTMPEILDALVSEQNTKLIEEYIAFLPSSMESLLMLEVPSFLQTLHLQIINAWQKKLSVFTALRNFNEDPLKAYLALQEVPNIIEEDLNLQEVLIKHYQDLKT